MASRSSAEQRRKPTYGAATRLARLVYELRDRNHGWSFEAVCEELGISERTLNRYLKACREELVDRRGNPLIETAQHGERRVLRLADRRPPPNSTDYEILALLFTRRLARVLEGTGLGLVNEDLWDKMRARIPAAQRHRLDHAERKFFSVPFLPKKYSDKEEELDTILRGLIDQIRLEVDYRGLTGEGKIHEFRPYSLVEHRGGLYVLGHSSHYRKVIWMAVDRIRSVRTKRSPDGERLRFDYPKTFDPERHTRGTFGLVAGEPTRVVLAINNEQTEAYLRERDFRSPKRFFQSGDGRTCLEVSVRGMEELANWVMATTPWVEVLEPAELRDAVVERIEAGRRVYRTQKPGRGAPG